MSAKSKNLIIQVAVKPNRDREVHRTTPTMFSYVPSLYEYSIAKAKEYAQKCEADYHCITSYEYDENLEPAYQKFAPFSSNHIDYASYDNIVYCDCDFVWLVDIAPNIFTLMDASEHDFFASPEPQHISSAVSLKNKLGIDQDSYLYFNSGLYGIKPRTMLQYRDELRQLCGTFKGFFDQGALNALIARHRPKYGALSKNWNWFLNKRAPLFSHHYMVHHKGQFTPAKIDRAVKVKLKRIVDNNIDITSSEHLWYHPHYGKDNKITLD